jgi:hypothetical protein
MRMCSDDQIKSAGSNVGTNGRIVRSLDDVNPNGITRVDRV